MWSSSKTLIGSRIRASTPREFWAEAIDSGYPIEVRTPTGTAFTMAGSALREDLGSLVPSSWAAAAATDTRNAIEKTRADQQWLRAADFKDLFQPRVPLELEG